MKVAIVSSVLPPVWSGQSILISRLLRDRSPDSYCLISDRDWSAEDVAEFAPRLPGRYYRFSTDRILTRGRRFDAVQRINARILGGRIARIAKKEGCTHIVAFSGSLNDLPAGLAASQILNVPFYAYVCDYYSQQHWDPYVRAIAARIEPRVLRGARGIIVLNEFLQAELNKLYGVEPAIIYNPCDLAAYEAAPAYEPRPSERRIVYTGAVYVAHHDAFRNLISAIELLRRPDLKLHIYTAQPPEELAEIGHSPSLVIHPHVAASEVAAIQKQADLLFLPLAFNSPYPLVINTSAPFKMGEYLAAGRPVLAHIPPDSFVAWYFRKHGCGQVVDQLDPAVLAHAIEQVLDDPEYGRQLAERATERAAADFRIEKARDEFWQFLQNGRS